MGMYIAYDNNKMKKVAPVVTLKNSNSEIVIDMASAPSYLSQYDFSYKYFIVNDDIILFVGNLGNGQWWNEVGFWRYRVSDKSWKYFNIGVNYSSFFLVKDAVLITGEINNGKGILKYDLITDDGFMLYNSGTGYLYGQYTNDGLLLSGSHVVYYNNTTGNITQLSTLYRYIKYFKIENGYIINSDYQSSNIVYFFNEFTLDFVTIDCNTNVNNAESYIINDGLILRRPVTGSDAVFIQNDTLEVHLISTSALSSSFNSVELNNNYNILLSYYDDGDSNTKFLKFNTLTKQTDSVSGVIPGRRTATMNLVYKLSDNKYLLYPYMSIYNIDTNSIIVLDSTVSYPGNYFYFYKVPSEGKVIMTNSSGLRIIDYINDTLEIPTQYSFHGNIILPLPTENTFVITQMYRPDISSKTGSIFIYDLDTNTWLNSRRIIGNDDSYNELEDSDTYYIFKSKSKIVYFNKLDYTQSYVQAIMEV